ncbi:MAG: tetratricopeptide repeat protein [Woeseiaceae bacterium]|nr:tetratricopeptide repeat protein [Woeseiaceae bacterium]
MSHPGFNRFAVLALALATPALGQNTQDDLPPAPLEQTVPVAEEEVPAPSETAPLEQAVPAADDQAPAPTEAAPLTEEQVLLEFDRFQRYLSDKNYDEADVSAKRVVEMTIRFYGPQTHETAKALNNLAIVQHQNRQYDAAVQNFTSAIEILEIVEDRLNDGLVNPLKGLGAAQLNQGRPDLASRSFQRATHITHVNEGPHNIEQVEILESLAEATVRMGDLSSAREVLDRIHMLNVRHFKGDALGLLPSLMRRGEWQHRAGYYNDERATYRRAIRIIETAAGKDDPRLITPLVRLGESYYYYDAFTDGAGTVSGATGETYFKRAVRVAESAEDYPWLELANTRLALADYYAYTEAHNRARKIYLEVWNSLSNDEDRLEMRREMLEGPLSLRRDQLPTYAGGPRSAAADPSGFLTGTIRVDYTVSARGRVRNIRTEASPPEFTDMQRMVHREVRRRMYRPQLVDGVPIESENQVFVHEFYYRQEQLDELRKKKELAAKSGQKTR